MYHWLVNATVDCNSESLTCFEKPIFWYRPPIQIVNVPSLQSKICEKAAEVILFFSQKEIVKLLTSIVSKKEDKDSFALVEDFPSNWKVGFKSTNLSFPFNIAQLWFTIAPAFVLIQNG